MESGSQDTHDATAAALPVVTHPTLLPMSPSLLGPGSVTARAYEMMMAEAAAVAAATAAVPAGGWLGGNKTANAGGMEREWNVDTQLAAPTWAAAVAAQQQQQYGDGYFCAPRLAQLNTFTNSNIITECADMEAGNE